MPIRSSISLIAFAVVLALGVPDPTGVAASGVKISPKECQRLVRHQARNDVNYKPGVDARGKKVKGADLNGGSKLKLPKEFSFNIGVDIAKKYGMDKKNIASEMNVGKVTVRGRNVYWNGQKLGSGDSSQIAAHCQRQLGGN